MFFWYKNVRTNCSIRNEYVKCRGPRTLFNSLFEFLKTCDMTKLCFTESLVKSRYLYQNVKKIKNIILLNLLYLSLNISLSHVVFYSGIRFKNQGQDFNQPSSKTKSLLNAACFLRMRLACYLCLRNLQIITSGMQIVK